MKNRAYRLTVLGYAAYTFALGGLAFWAPAFLERVRGMPKAQATVQFGSIVVVTGFVGTFAGGWAGDYFLRRETPERLTRHLVRQLERLGQSVTLKPLAEAAR